MLYLFAYLVAGECKPIVPSESVTCLNIMAEEADFNLKKLFKFGKKLEKDQPAPSVTKRVTYKDLDDDSLFEYDMRHE